MRSAIIFIALTQLTLSGLLGCSGPDQSSQTEKLRILNSQGQISSLYDKSLWDVALQANTRLQAGSLLLNYKDPLSVNLKAQFLSDQSKMVLNAYTTSLTTNDGTRLEFKPNAENGIDVYLFTRDYPLYHFCTIEHSVSKNGMMDLNVQLSDSDNRGPVIAIWNMYYDGKNKRKKSYNLLNAASADCNSQNEIFIDHFGSGRLWGLEIQQTRVQDVRRSQAYDL